MELDKDLLARQEARTLARESQAAQKILSGFSQSQLDAITEAVAAAFAREAGIPLGSALAYLIAPPLESMYALDAALKAADVKLCKLYAPPSETNFGGALLTGTQSACAAACTAFAQAIQSVAETPIDR